MSDMWKNYITLKNKANIRIIPKTIRYQPKILNECFLMYKRNHFITTKAIKKDTIKPKAIVPQSPEEKLNPDLYISYKAAESIVGTANRNENSVIRILFIFIDLPAIITAPERDTPGITAKA